MSDPYYDFFQFLDSESESLAKIPIIERNQLLEKFYRLLKDYYSKKEFESKKDNIKKSYDYLLKKLHSISFLRDDEQFVSDIKWDKIIEFYSLIKHIKKSDERTIRWAIFNLFASGKKSISLKELKSSLSEFKISNLERMINKIIQQASSDGLNITLKNETITLDHKITDENVIHNLVEHVEYVSRRSRGELEQQILDLLDQGSYSNQEIAEICDADKSMVSKTMNQLEKVDKTIVYSSGGPRGIRYYTTNCENCPWGLERQECRKKATEYISNHLSKEFDMELPSTYFDGIKTNQAILRMKTIFMHSRNVQKIELERNLSENLENLFSTILLDSIKKSTKKSKKTPYVSLASVLSKLPTLYAIGYLQGSKNGMNTMDTILGQVLKSQSESQRKEIKNDIIQEFNRYFKIISSG